MKDKLKIALYVFLIVLAIAAIISIGVYAYKHRVIESKRFTVTATINARDYRPPYTTYTTYYDKHGKHVLPFRHPQHYYIYYTVDFDGELYSENVEEVDAKYFNVHKDGDEVNAIFERQWRADGSETYRIYLDR